MFKDTINTLLDTGFRTKSGPFSAFLSQMERLTVCEARSRRIKMSMILIRKFGASRELHHLHAKIKFVNTLQGYQTQINIPTLALFGKPVTDLNHMRNRLLQIGFDDRITYLENRSGLVAFFARQAARVLLTLPYAS